MFTMFCYVLFYLWSSSVFFRTSAANGNFDEVKAYLSQGADIDEIGGVSTSTYIFVHLRVHIVQICIQFFFYSLRVTSYPCFVEVQRYPCTKFWFIRTAFGHLSNNKDSFLNRVMFLKKTTLNFTNLFVKLEREMAGLVEFISFFS